MQLPDRVHVVRARRAGHHRLARRASEEPEGASPGRSDQQEEGEDGRMRVVVCGSREGVDPKIVWATLDGVHRETPITVIVHGACRGVDLEAAWWAMHQDLTVSAEAHPADWSRGRRAGPERNERMAAAGADLCIAIHTGSRGTQDMIRRARAHGIPVREVLVNGSTSMTTSAPRNTE
ncbi:MAG: DUF2493 domain-containing protein [Microbacterium sp.]